MSKFYQAVERQKFASICNPDLGYERFYYDSNRSLDFIQAAIYAASSNSMLREFETQRLGILTSTPYKDVVLEKNFNMFSGNLAFASALSSFDLCFKHISSINNTTIEHKNSANTLTYVPLELRFDDDNIGNTSIIAPAYNSKAQSYFRIDVIKINRLLDYTIAHITITFFEFYLDIKDKNRMRAVMSSMRYRESSSPLADAYIKSIAYNKNKNILENCPKGMELNISLQIDLDRLINAAKSLMQYGSIAPVGNFFFPTTKYLDNTIKSKERYMFAKSICILYNTLFSNDLKAV